MLPAGVDTKIPSEINFFIIFFFPNLIFNDAALRVYNYLHTMTLEAQLLARACGKTNIHSLEPEDMAALTMEASALAKVPLSGTNHTVGVDDFHKI